MASEQLLTREQVAAQLGVSTKTLAKWAWQGIGPKFIYLSKTMPRYRQSDVDAWLATRTQGGQSPLDPVIRLMDHMRREQLHH